MPSYAKRAIITRDRCAAITRVRRAPITRGRRAAITRVRLPGLPGGRDPREVAIITSGTIMEVRWMRYIEQDRIL